MSCADPQKSQVLPIWLGSKTEMAWQLWHRRDQVVFLDLSGFFVEFTRSFGAAVNTDQGLFGWIPLGFSSTSRAAVFLMRGAFGHEASLSV
jgi:hypothetical protein